MVLHCTARRCRLFVLRKLNFPPRLGVQPSTFRANNFRGIKTVPCPEFCFLGEEWLPKLAKTHWRFQTIYIEAENIKNKITFSVEFSSLMRNPFKECLTPILNEWCQSRYLVLHPTRRLAGSSGLGLGLGHTTECPLGNANRLQVLYFILYLVRYTKKLGQARITEF